MMEHGAGSVEQGAGSLPIGVRNAEPGATDRACARRVAAGIGRQGSGERSKLSKIECIHVFSIQGHDDRCGATCRVAFFRPNGTREGGYPSNIFELNHDPLADVPFVGAADLCELKKTNREKDYAVIGELARLIPDRRQQLLLSRSARDLIRVARETLHQNGARRLNIDFDSASQG